MRSSGHMRPRAAGARVPAVEEARSSVSKLGRRVSNLSSAAVAALAVTAFLYVLMLKHSFAGGPCTNTCATRLLARTRAVLLLQPGADNKLQLGALTVPAARPYTLATCTNCACDVCAFLQSNRVFAPVESLIWEFILRSPDCDGSKAVADVGANIGSFALLAAQYECTHVVAFEPNAAPRALLAASVALNGVAARVTVLPYALGAAHGAAVVDASADKRWGLAALSEVPVQQRSRSAQPHTLGDGPLSAPPAPRSATRRPGTVSVLPLSEITQLTRHLLLLKIDTEGYEGNVLAGAWALWDAGRTADNVLLEVKSWNTRAKRDLLRHLARTAGLLHVYTYNELYGSEPVDLQSMRLNGRLVDVTEVILTGQYDVMLPHEDYWLRREALPAAFLDDS